MSDPDVGVRAGRVRVARIGGAHGVRGEVRLMVFTETPEALADLGPFEDEAGARSFALTALRRQGGGFVARLSGIGDRAAAEAVRNTDLYVARHRLPPIDEDDTFYQADLVGLAVMAPDGVAVGRVVAVHNFGAGDIIEIAPQPPGATVMIPFTSAMIPVVDITGGRLTLAHGDLVASPPHRTRSSRE